jgi:RHS repeat-associated protein
MLLRNHRGDTVAVVEPNGTFREVYVYGLWGDSTVFGCTTTSGTGTPGNTCTIPKSNSTLGNSSQFAGTHRSPLTNLYHMGARWYSTALRQFISRDPLGQAVSFDEWLYTVGDPMNFVDRSGLSPSGIMNWGADVERGAAGQTGGTRVFQPITCDESIGPACEDNAIESRREIPSPEDGSIQVLEFEPMDTAPRPLGPMSTDDLTQGYRQLEEVLVGRDRALLDPDFYRFIEDRVLGAPNDREIGFRVFESPSGYDLGYPGASPVVGPECIVAGTRCSVTQEPFPSGREFEVIAEVHTHPRLSSNRHEPSSGSDLVVLSPGAVGIIRWPGDDGTFESGGITFYYGTVREGYEFVIFDPAVIPNGRFAGQPDWEAPTYGSADIPFAEFIEAIDALQRGDLSALAIGSRRAYAETFVREMLALMRVTTIGFE